MSSIVRPTEVLVSVVSPVFCEEESILEFYSRVVAVIERIEPVLQFELVLVNDGSTDGSGEVMRKIAEKDQRVKVIALSRNFGHQIAITAGLDYAKGDAIVLIDSDLQDPPEVIEQMIEKWREGFDVVYGQRVRREGEAAFKLVTAKLFYRLVNALSEVDLPVDTGDFRLLDRKVANALRNVREENRYIRGLVAWLGFSQAAVQYERQPRYGGTTKFTLQRMIRFALDAVTSFSEKPLRLAAQVGVLSTVLSVVVALWILIGKITSPERSVPGFASLILVMLFFGGLQMLFIGVLGEYVGRIYRETKARPLYVVADTVNLPESTRE